MCGIVGCITINKISNDKIDKLNNLQYHRGPDGNGTYTEQIDKKNLTLLHQRLSIIDLSDGSQPMLDSKKELIIVFNGEIFNHMELKTKLKDKGYEFLTDHSDTEVLLYMYKEYKENMLDYLNGMFAFVIFDKKNKQLFGARDRTGIKPLYYSVKDKEFYFASELKTLLEFGLKKEIDFQSLSNYLSFQFVPSPKTIFKNISKLEAGNYFIFDIKNTKLDIRRFYKIEFNKTIKNEKDATAKIQKQFRDSINLWSMSDVEVGASLSGGLDSSAIVAMYSKISEKKIKTYSLGFEGNLKSLDERKYAKLVSEKYNTNHHEFVLTEDKLLSELDDMIYHLDEPYAGGLPSWYVYKMMKNDIKVSLTGTGGDELFGNYNKSLVYNSSLRKIKRFSNFSRGNFKKAFQNYIQYPKGFFYHRYFKGFEINDLLVKDNLIKPERIIEDLIIKSEETDFRNIVPFIDFRMQLPEEFLHVTDRFSMAHSIEARVPFLDPDMIDLVMSIDPKIRMKYKSPKYLLKESFKELIPNDLLSKPKTGFVIPEAQWLRTILKGRVEYFLGEEYLVKQNIFNKNIYKKYVVPHLSGNKDYSWQIWTILMFQLWYDRFMD